MVFVGRARKPVWTPDAYALEKVAWSSKGLPDHGGWRKAKKRPLVHNREWCRKLNAVTPLWLIGGSGPWTPPPASSGRQYSVVDIVLYLL